MDNDSITNYATFILAVNLTFSNHTTGNSSNLGNLEDLFHLKLTSDNLLLHLVKHTHHR